MKNAIDQNRREFLATLAMASAAICSPPFLKGCKDPDAFTGKGEAPYKVWEEMLYHLQTSPDHLKGRMDQLIADRDAKAMFDFIRDEFYLIPITEKSIGYGDTNKWGVRYALRSGSATMREKAELLCHMYQKAGIKSKVVLERTNISPEEASEFFFRPIERQFLPEISKKMMRRWAKQLKVSGITTELISSNDEVEKAEVLGEKIWQTLQLPEDYYHRAFDFRWPNYGTPTVEFELEAQIKYAHLFDPKVPFGELKSGDPNNVSEAKSIKLNEKKVSVRVTYRDSITPKEEKELIRREWLATDLVGRQLDIIFLNNLTLEEQAITLVGNIRTFTPALALQAMDESQESMTQRSVLSDPITLAGKRIQISAKGETLKVGENTLLEKVNPDLQKQVQSMDVKAKTTGYPGVKLSISPTDNNGNLVEGLSATDFNITEDGRPIRAIMENNQRTPRILIMSDVSMSMPSEYRNEGMEKFVLGLKSKILELYPAAIVTHWGTPSSLYTWLLKASQTENDLVIFATDGDNNDTYDPKDEAIYRSGPPAVVLDVYGKTSRTETFEHMAELTDGVHLPITDQTGALDGIMKYLKNIEIQPYTFTYFSVGSTGERTVEVSIDQKRVTAKISYKFETIEGGSKIGPRIIGLYLELKYGNQYAVKRVLAGWDNVVHPSDQPSQAMADAVNDLMLGGMQLYLEGDGPTYSAILSDILKARLSTREWGEKLIDKDIDGAKQAFQKGHFNISSTALTLMSPITQPATPSSLTIPGGLRVGLQTIKPGFITGTTYALFDYLPTSAYGTLAADPVEGFKTTLIKTAQLAIREGELFEQSTYSQLAGSNWISLKDARANKWLSEEKFKNDYYYWRERVDRGAALRVFDQTASSKAFWDIKDTGELYGILANGSGGGGDDTDNDIEKLEYFMTALSSLMGIMQHYKMLNGIGGFSLALVAQYGVTLVKLYAIASEAIMIMDASGMDENIQRVLQQFACEVAKETVYATTGEVGGVMGGLDTLIGLMNNGTGIFNCN